ncbi:MAG: hypothetical protein WC505_02365 [Patescibacteria group bacterium]
MPIPVFEQQPAETQGAPGKPTKEKVSGLAIFFAVLLGTVLVFMGEFLFLDVNRVFNPYYVSCFEEASSSLSNFFSHAPFLESCDVPNYERARLILHADVAVPLILVGLFAYVIIRKRELKSHHRALFFAYLAWIVWMGGRLLAETEYYFLKHHALIGKYIVFVTVALIFSWIVIEIQRRFIKGKKPDEPAAPKFE